MAEADDLDVLDHKLKQLRLDYERYFLGARPREPVLLRGDVQKLITLFSNRTTTNTAARFRFSSLCSRYQSMRARWDETLRQIEAGTYVRHQFKAALHQRERAVGEAPAPPPPPSSDLYQAYLEARRACGQSVKELSPDKLDGILARQRESLRERYPDAEFAFRVVVEEGRAKLKASRIRS